MADHKRLELAPGVCLTAVQTNKFKSSVLSVTLLTPLNKESASVQALVPYVLRRGTEKHPDMNALAAALDELYGGSIEPVVRKKGESQCIGFVGSFLDDAYTLEGESILEQAADLMGELLLHPYREEGGFCREYVEGERANLIDRIRAQINDKRQYSVQKLIRTMCESEAYGVDRFGSEESAGAISPESLWQAYQTLLSDARVEVYYCGSAPLERVQTALRHALEGLPAGKERVSLTCQVKAEPERKEPNVLEEAMDVTQGKLAMGFRTGGVNIWSEEFPVLLVFNAVYGGTTTSKLFMNVREKLSLCYFASSMLEKIKGVMLVSSGIEFEKYEQARDEILAQLESCRQGEIEDWELVGAIRSIVSALQTTLDSQGRLEDYWLGQIAAGETEGPAELAGRVEAVTKEQVMKMARQVKLDTIYFLKGQEE